MKLFLILLVAPVCCLHLLYLSQSGVYAFANTPFMLAAMGRKGDLLSILILVLFAAGCIAAALWSARDAPFLPQASISLLFSIASVIPPLFKTSLPLSQILFNLVIQSAALMAIIFPAVSLGTAVCALLLKPIERMIRRNINVRRRFGLNNRPGHAILTVLATLFLSAALQAVLEAFGATCPAALPTNAERYLSSLAPLLPGMFPGAAVNSFLKSIPLVFRIAVLVPCAITLCVWEIGAVRRALRRPHTARLTQPLQPRQAPSPLLSNVRPIAAVQQHAAAPRIANVQTGTGVNVARQRQPGQSPRPRANTTNAIFEQMERALQSGGVIGLNTRTGRATPSP